MAHTSEQVRAAFLEWLRATDTTIEVEDVDEEGDSLSIAVPTSVVATMAARMGITDLERLVGPLLAPPEVDVSGSIAVPDGHDYEKWTEAKRRRANIAAIRALRQYQHSGRDYLTAEEKKALLAFSGWGGIKISALPEDPTVWPADFLAALKDFKAAKVERRAPIHDTFRGLLQQFFTPVPVARFMAELAARAVKRPVQTILEPSAGVGRLIGVLDGSFGPPVQSIPLDAVKFMGEYDPFLQSIEAALYPDAIRASAAFEIVARRLDAARVPGPFDLVLSNPPYPRRTGLYRDEHGSDWSRAAAYFTWASMRLLAPGGAICTLVPVGQMTAPDHAAVALRRFLMQEAECVAAVPIPVDVFPGALVQTVIHVWVKRAQPLTTAGLTTLLKSDPRTLAIIKGQAIQRVEGKAETFGTWVQSTRWKNNLELRSNGVPLDAEQVPLAHVAAPVYSPRSEAELEELSTLLRKTADAAAKIKLGRVVAREIAAEEGTLMGAAIALDTRLTHYLNLRGSTSAETLAQAEALRVELLNDTEGFIGRWGNPHLREVLRANKRQVATLLAVVAVDGRITDVLRDVASEDPVDVATLGPDPTVEEVVAFYCERLGECPESKLDRHLAVVPDPSTFPESVCLWLEPDGFLKLYTKAAYLSGALYPRIDNAKAALSGEPAEWLQVRMRRQIEWLTAALGEKAISEIEITPTSGFLTLEGDDPWAILNAYVAWKIDSIKTSYETAPKVRLYQEARKFKVERTGDWPRAQTVLRIDKVIEREEGESTTVFRDRQAAEQNARHKAKKFPAAWVFVLRLVGYLNNDTDIPDIDGGETKPTATQRYSSTDFEARVREDAEIVDAFRSWLMSQEDWHPVIEAQYNRAYRGYAAGVPSDAPLPIMRFSHKVRLGAQQNQGVRWFSSRGAGILAFGVGIGKTFTGIASIAWERQRGAVKRAMVLVPDGLIVNWYREFLRALPDYRVCTIGYEIDPNDVTNLKGIDNDARAVQWKRVALGEYEVAICGYTKFLRDVELSKPNARRYIENLPWFQSGMAEDAEQIAILTRKRAEAVKKQVVYTRILSTVAEGDTEVLYGQEVHLVATIRKAAAEIDEWIAKLDTQLDALGAKPLADGAVEQIRDKVEDQLSKLRPRGAEVMWRASDSTTALRTHLQTVLVTAGNGSLAAGAAALFTSSDWAAAYAKNVKDVEGWLGTIRKLDVVQMLSQFDPPDYEAAQSSPVPSMVTWEALQVDMLVVDEAHNFKNLFAPERNPYGSKSIAYMGAPSGDTNRSWDLWVKTQYVLERNQNRGVLLLTATPEKNSPLEVYNLINYVSLDCWTARGLTKPDDFVSRYLVTDKAWVPKPKKAGDDTEGTTEVVFTEAVTGFKCQLELWVARDQYTFTKTIDDVPELKLRVPEAQEHRVEFDLDPDQYTLYQDASLVVAQIQREMKAAEAAGEGQTDPSLGLRLLDLLGKIALDPRLLSENYATLLSDEANAEKRAAKYAAWERAGAKGKPPPSPFGETKLLGLSTSRRILDALAARCAERLGLDPDRGIPDLPELLKRLFPRQWIPPKYRELQDTIRTLGTECGHIIFTDSMDAIRQIEAALIDQGIDGDRIGIMTSATAKSVPARQALMDAFNGTLHYDDVGNIIPEKGGDPPAVDILIGTTAIMGEGANLQVRTCVVHHVTLPWEPATIEQRNGRAVRQGNILKLLDSDFKVTIAFYLAKYTTDSQKYDAILGKGAWQQLLKVADAADREDVVDNPAASFERVVRILALAEQDPEAAVAKLNEARAIMEQRRAARFRMDLAKRLGKLEAQARKVRQARDPYERQVAARIYTDLARLLLQYGASTAVGLEAAILKMLERPTYYDMDSGLIVSAGDFIRVQNAAGRHSPSVEILTTGVDGYFTVRAWGSIEATTAYHLSELLGARDLNAVLIVEDVGESWDAAGDRQGQLRWVVGHMGDTSRWHFDLLNRIRGLGLQNIWDAVWGMNHPGYSFKPDVSEPPLPVRDPHGRVILFEQTALMGYLKYVGDYTPYRRDYLQATRLKTATAWLQSLQVVTNEEFIEALSTENVWCQVPATHQSPTLDVAIPGTEPSYGKPQVIRLEGADVWHADQARRIAAVASRWFGLHIGQGMMKSIKAAIRKHRTDRGLQAPMSTLDMHQEAHPAP